MSNLEPGQSFGHYTIVSQSASDEGGTLYRAYDSTAASDVLLRVLPASLVTRSGELPGDSAGTRLQAAPTAVLRAESPLPAGFDARFQALGAALRKLSHPNILRVLESGIVDGTPYLSMSSVEAVPLSERIASGQIAPAQADKLVSQIAGALQYAHANGVAHGALSPAHVLVDGSGNALLTDFGLAALQAGSAAPDPHADVAALGGVLLSLLTGKPTPPDSAALADALVQLTSALSADRRDEVKGAYTRVITKLTAADPANRFDSARDFLTAWQEAGKTSAGSAAASTRVAAPPIWTPPPQTPPAAPPPMSPPPVPGPTAPLSPAAQNLAQRAKALADQAAKVLADQQAKALADQQAKALADQQADSAAPAAGTVQSDTVFAQAQARDAAARGVGAKGSVRDGVRAALEITQRLARATPDPARRAALEQIVADIQQIGDQRAAGQLTDEAAHAAISDLVRQIRHLEAQGMPAGRDAVKGVAAAALSQAKAGARAEAPVVAHAVRQQAAAAAKPLANQARPVLFGGAGLIMVVCVGLMIVCAVATSAFRDATPTPRAVVTASLTRSAPTPNARPSPTRLPPRATTSAAVPTPASPDVPLRTSVVFTGTFVSGQCDLAEGDDSRRTLKCDRNEYVMLIKPSTSRWAYYDAPPEYQDIVIDFDARAISSSPAMQYGIIWRVSSDGQSFYGFTLKPNGQMAVFISKDSDFSYFVRDLSVNNFRTGGGLNHVTITANGPQLSFAVNGEPLPLTLSDTTLTSGTIGFIVDTTAPNAQAAFSNLIVSEIH